MASNTQESIEDLIGDYIPAAPIAVAEEAYDSELDDYNPNEVTYEASTTAKRFHASDQFVRGMAGPIGSGKSVACCIEIIRRAREQERGPDKIRRSRWVIVRNTYRELQDTTLKTWNDWIPADMREWREGTMTCTVKFNDVICEVLFRALERPDDDKKLLSLELTGAWINEAKEVPKAILDMVQGRVGRFPRTIRMKGRTFGPTWCGVIMDTNMMDVDHWWYRIFEEEKPASWGIFKQPDGLGPDAENVENLPENYYQNLMVGHDQQWIDVYVHGKYGFIMDGMPVHPNFHTNIHVSEEFLEPVPNVPIFAGIDFGRTPAITFAQKVNGQWNFLSEVVTFNIGATQFAKEVNTHINLKYKGFDFGEITGDPAGEQKTQVADETPFDVLYANNIHAVPCLTNDVTIRRDTLGNLLLHNTMMGSPCIRISPACKTLVKGLAGGFKYKRVQVAGDAKYKDEPDKNQYSHVCEAAEYLLCGAGESDSVITPKGKNGGKKPKVKRSLRRSK